MYSCVCVYFIFFFFKQKTAYEMRISDWSSDVCSSDLLDRLHHRLALALEQDQPGDIAAQLAPPVSALGRMLQLRLKRLQPGLELRQSHRLLACGDQRGDPLRLRAAEALAEPAIDHPQRLASAHRTTRGTRYQHDLGPRPVGARNSIGRPR